MSIAVGDKALTREGRFWRRVDKTDTCWMWRGGRAGREGCYGIFRSADGRHTSAHRVAYEILVGPIPDGLVLDHLCNVPLCVNPEHLEPVTAAENRARQARRQTRCRRAGHPLEGENLYVDKDGKRACRTCRTAAEARRRARKEGR